MEGTELAELCWLLLEHEQWDVRHGDFWRCYGLVGSFGQMKILALGENPFVTLTK